MANRTLQQNLVDAVAQLNAGDLTNAVKSLEDGITYLLDEAVESGDLVKASDLDDYLKTGDVDDVAAFIRDNELVEQNDLPDFADFVKHQEMDDLIRDKGLVDEDDLEGYLEASDLGEALQEMDPEEMYKAMTQHGFAHLQDLHHLKETHEALKQRGFRGLLRRVKWLLTGSI